MRITVSDGYQLGNDAEGTLYQPGESFDASKPDAEMWIAAGMAVKAKVKVKMNTGATAKAVFESKNKAVTAPQVENKTEVKK